jgi:hypothetical protein
MYVLVDSTGTKEALTVHKCLELYTIFTPAKYYLLTTYIAIVQTSRRNDACSIVADPVSEAARMRSRNEAGSNLLVDWPDPFTARTYCPRRLGCHSYSARGSFL